MSRTIDWSILFPKQDTLRTNQVAEIGRQISAAGFGLVNPHQGQIMLLGGAGEGYIPVLNESSLFEYISTHATSLVSIWKESLEVSLEFDPTGRLQVDQAGALGIDDDSVFGTVTIQLDRTYLHNRSSAISIIGDVQNLFALLCSCLGSPFGFALDEWCIEGLAEEWHLQREVAACILPSIQLPVSYYSTNYFANLSLSKFTKMGYRCELVGTSGWLVTNIEELLV